MSATSKGMVRCEKPEKYIQQLVKHWSHKMDATYDEGDGVGAFPFSEDVHAEMTARPEGIAITLVTPDAEAGERMQGVIERHIDRFAFREAPLNYEWSVS